MTNEAGGQPDPQDITRLRVAVGRLHRRLAQRASGQLTFAQLSALVTIEKLGPIRSGELALREQVAAPSMTRTVAGLIEAGLADKVPDPLDGRSSLIVATAEARALLEEVRTERAAMLTERVGRLSANDYAVLAAAIPVLEKLAEEEGAVRAVQRQA
ncbi:MAG TPA: MarR family transcriptional regulator [Actinocrinis sp.]|jgi:DNA-binding MarR family transcriptional regulator